MDLFNVCMIRTRVNKDSPWRYELCDEEELQLYEYTKDSYRTTIDWGDGSYRKLNNMELEILANGVDLILSQDIKEKILDYMESEGVI